MEASEIDINSTSEFVAAAFHTTTLKKQAVIGCQYRPTDNNCDYHQKMCRTITDLQARYTDNIMWLDGDANLPDTDWTEDSIKGHQYAVPIN